MERSAYHNFLGHCHARFCATILLLKLVLAERSVVDAVRVDAAEQNGLAARPVPGFMVHGLPVRVLFP